MKPIFLALFGLALAASHAQANLITNGSFEDGTVDPNQGQNHFVTLGVPNNSITGWTVGSGTVDYIGSYWQAAEGGRSIDLSGDGPGSIYQDFATVLGQTYSVTFDLAGNPDGGPTTKTITASIDGTTFSQTFNTSGHSDSSMGWTPETFTFVANGSSSRLTFASDDSTAYGPALDGVAVSAVPLPGSLALFGSALLGLGAFAFFKRKQNAGVTGGMLSA